MLTLSVDELRVAAVVADAAVPSLLDQYATADTAADAAARRGLVARGLLADEALAPSLAALLAPLTDPSDVVEYEAVGTRAARVLDTAGRATTLTEIAPDVWRVGLGAGLDVELDAAATSLRGRPAASGNPVSLTVGAHLSLLGLLQSPAAIGGFLTHHLGAADGARLADAFAPDATAGRVIHTTRDVDVVTVVRTGWLAGPGGVWRVEEADPDDLDPRSRFVPCDGSDVVAAVADVRGLAVAVTA